VKERNKKPVIKIINIFIYNFTKYHFEIQIIRLTTFYYHSIMWYINCYLLPISCTT